MRLAVVTSQFPARVNTFFARDMRALIEAGIGIDVFPIYPCDDALWTYVPDCLDERALPRSRTHHIGIGQATRARMRTARAQGGRLVRDTRDVLSSALPFGAAAVLKTAYTIPKACAWAQLAEGRYDHVFAYWGNYAGTCAWMLTRLLARPTPFSLFLHAGTDLYRNQVFMREKLRAAATIVTECEFNREFLRDLYPDLWPAIADKIHVNHMGVDLRELAVGSGPRAPHRVLAVGRLDPRKGYEYLIRAVARLVAHGIPIELELVGDGPAGPALRALSGELGLDAHVRFRGWLHFTEVRRAMSEATIFVHPSSGIGDAKPNVIEEAMAIGVPVIASRVAGIPELLDDGRCGVLVPPRDVDVLAREIAALLADPARRGMYAAAARRHAEDTLDLWRNGRRLADRLRAGAMTRPAGEPAGRAISVVASV